MARGKGEGSIYWLEGKQRWAASITLPDGRRKEHLAKTKREAQQWLNATKLAQEKGTLATGPSQTTERFLTQWLTDTAQHRVRPTTFRRYGEIVHQHCIPVLGKLVVGKVTAQHLQRLYSDKLESGLAPATVQYIHRVLHRAFEDAVRWDLIARNPCDLVDAPRATRPELQVLNEEQTCQFLRAAREDRLEALYALAVTTGMRQGELLGLKWEDIDGNQLHVRRTLHYIVGKGHVWGEPKSATSRRRITLGPLAIMALNRHRERQAGERGFAGEKWLEQGLVFTNLCGGPLIPRNVFGRSFVPLLERAGLVLGGVSSGQRQQVLSVLQQIPQWAALSRPDQETCVANIAKASAGSLQAFGVMLQAACQLAAAGGIDPKTGKPVRSIRARYRATVKEAMPGGQAAGQGCKQPAAPKRIRFHDLRHSAATMMLVQGTHPKVVQEMLGHSAIAVTMDIYSHVLPGLQEEAVERMSRRLEAASAAAEEKEKGEADAIAGAIAGLG